MAPDDQVEEVRDERLGNVVGGTPLGTILIQHGLTGGSRQAEKTLDILQKRQNYTWVRIEETE